MQFPSDWHFAMRSRFHYFILNSAADLKSSVVFSFSPSFLTHAHIKASLSLHGVFLNNFHPRFPFRSNLCVSVRRSDRQTQEFSRAASKCTSRAYLQHNFKLPPSDDLTGVFFKWQRIHGVSHQLKLCVVTLKCIFFLTLIKTYAG